MSFAVRMLSSVSLVTAVACGGGSPGPKVPVAPRDADAGAKPPRASCEKPSFGVVGGKITRDFPETLKVTITKKDGSSSYCTGSFYSPRLLVFAAHCVPGGVSFALESGEKATAVKVHPKYAPEVTSVTGLGDVGPIVARILATGLIDDAVIGSVDTEDDVAILVFPPRADRKVVRVAPPGRAGTPVRIVGYGAHEELATVPTFDKRTGLTSIRYFYGQTIVTIGGTGGVARVGPGDSGGTLFHAETGEGLGIVSAGAPNSIFDVQAWANYQGIGRSYFVNLNSPSVREFVEGTFKDLGEPSPYGARVGAGPTSGDAGDQGDAGAGAGSGAGTDTDADTDEPTQDDATAEPPPADGAATEDPALEHDDEHRTGRAC